MWVVVALQVAGVSCCWAASGLCGLLLGRRWVVWVVVGLQVGWWWCTSAACINDK